MFTVKMMVAGRLEVVAPRVEVSLDERLKGALAGFVYVPCK